MHTYGSIFRLRQPTGMISMSSETFLWMTFMIIQSINALVILVPVFTRSCWSKSSGLVALKWRLLIHFSPGRTMMMEMFLIVVAFVLRYRRSVTDLIHLLYLH